MNAEQLRAAQAPLKARYKTDAAAALVVLEGRGAPEVGEQICHVETFLGTVEVGCVQR